MQDASVSTMLKLGRAFIVTAVLAEAVQPFKVVIVTLYVPVPAVVTPVMVGFWEVDVKLFGPVQLHMVAVLPVTVKLRLPPAQTGLFEPGVTVRVGQMTVAVSLLMLLVETGSAVVLVTVAVLIIRVVAGVAALTVATMTMFALAPFANVPTVQFGAVHEPTEGVALTSERLTGSTSFMETAAASLGPLFVTVIV